MKVAWTDDAVGPETWLGYGFKPPFTFHWVVDAEGEWYASLVETGDGSVINVLTDYVPDDYVPGEAP